MFKKKTFTSNPDQCTPQQLETLAKLRLRIRELGYPEANYEDTYLLRFLCARKFDIEKTLQMWKNFIDWRNSRNIDQITALEFPDMKAAKPYYPHTWFRTDKQGRPIFIERMGKLKTEEMLKIIPLDRVELYFIRDFEKLLKEKLPACSAAYGAPINNTCYIMDFKGATSNFMSARVWEMLKIASKIGQDYYPETLGDMFVLNAPMVVTASWSIVKHLMDERTRTKIHILGSNYKNELLKYIDEENLPDFLGGKVTEEEYGVNLTNEQGPWIRGPLEEKDTEHSEIIIGQIENIEIKEEEPEILKKIQSSPFKKMKTIEEEVDELEVSQERPIRHHVRSFSAQSSLMFNLGHLVDLVDDKK